MIFKKDELKLLWPFYLYYFILGLTSMITPFMIIYFRNLNLTYLQIALITSCFGMSMFIFEVPTGAFADGFSRKYSVILGFIITGVAVSLIPLTTNFYLILSMWILAGIGITFVSGAEESWVIDNLNKYKRKDLHHEFFIKGTSIIAFGAIFAPIIGAMIVKSYSIKLLWYIFGFGFLLNSVILLIFGKEHYKFKKLKLIKSIKNTWKNSKKGLSFTLKHKTIFILILAGIFSQMMVISDNGIQPFMISLGMSEYQLGYMYSIIAIIMMISPFFSRFFSNFKPTNAMTIITTIKILTLFSIIFLYPKLYLIAATIFIIDGALKSLKNPIYQSYFHKHIPSNIRATVVSTKNMLSVLILSLASLIAGKLLDIFGPQKVLAYGSLFGIIAIILYQKIKK